MYESILRTATGEPDFQFKLVTKPYPVLQKYKDAERKTSVASLLFVLAIGFCILPATIVGHIMAEREQNLKHMQVISGMNMFSYWTINVLFDIFKMEIPMALCVGLLYAFRLKDYYPSMYVFFLFPVGVVPFTHGLSFLFGTEWSA
jgi:ATP-binding cassette subfamily A (ABC1) protein 3